MDNKLDWTKSCVYFLRRLKSLNIYRMMLRISYESVLASVILFAVVCLDSKLRVADTNRLHKLIGKVSDDVRLELDSDGSVREEDAVQITCHRGQYIPPTPGCSGQTQKYVRSKTSTKIHHRASKEVMSVAMKLYNSFLWVLDSQSQ